MGAPHSAADAATGRVHVAEDGNDTVAALDGAPFAVLAAMPVGRGPHELGVNGRTGRFYVANGQDHSVTALDGARARVIVTIAVGGSPGAVAVNERTNRVYVAEGAGAVAVLDGATDRLRATTSVGQQPAALVAAVTAHGPACDRALLVTALHTGLRAEELCGLRPADVTVGARSGVVRVYGKRNKYREVPPNSTARDTLRAYLPTLPKAAVCLFPSRKGGETVGGAGGEEAPKAAAPVTPRALGYLVARYARLARVPDLSPHDLRHRFGYRMAKAVPLHRLAQLMGHDSLDTTRIYVASTRQDLQEAVETIAWA